jgi:type VI secretion system VgrG family protein
MSGLAHPSDRNTPSPGATQNRHLLAIDTALGKDVLLLTSLDGVETVSRGFVYTVEMLTLESDDKVRGLLGHPVTLWLRKDSETERRPLHGHIRHLTRLPADARGYRTWRAEVVPFMWFLTRSVDCRIYQDLTIPEIIRSVFADHELLHYDLRLHDQYPKLVFCVQYRESAFAFISRLMEHAGISYWFEHQEDRHVLVLADANLVAKFTEPREAMVSLRPDLGQIYDLVHDFTFRTGAWAQNDFDFEVPTKDLHTHEPTVLDVVPMKRYEIFDYPGSYTGPEDGKRLTRLRIQEEEARHHQVSGSGSCVGFDAGRRFTLTSDRSVKGDKPASYLLTEVRHSARDSNYFSTTSEPATYSNRFVCIPVETPFRPERLTPKPIVQGPQTATVVGPAGENIHTDEYGRVRLKFHWDRRGKRDEHASCWIRVSQTAAGSHWGGLAIPHVGQEVIVAFLEGDPDRPMVTGHVHNGDNMPPLNLPRDKDKTIVRDHGDNKLIMHGKAGCEWLSVVSPRAVNLVAKRSAAKPLSADIVLNNVDFDSSQDSKGYSDLFALWQELEGKPAPSTTTASALPDAVGKAYSVDPSGVDDAYQADVNLLGEGRINSLSGGNTNTWVGKNMNAWTKGDQNTVVEGRATSTVYGRADNEVRGGLHNIIRPLQTDVYPIHLEVTPVLHAEETTIHVELTGTHIETTSAHIEQTFGAHVNIHYGVESDIGPEKTEVKFVETHVSGALSHYAETAWIAAVEGTSLGLQPAGMSLVGLNLFLTGTTMLTLNSASVLVNGAEINIG